MDRAQITLACERLHQGQVIAYPTEAVWGLGCDPFNQAAVERILAIKQRPVEKGLILVAADTDQIRPLVDKLSPAKQAQLQRSWPGPVTWLLPDPSAIYPAWIRGSHASVAIRVSAHPLVHALCETFGKPLVSTSANAAGEPPLRSEKMVQQHLGASIDMIVSGELGDSDQPSTIRDIVTGRVIR